MPEEEQNNEVNGVEENVVEDETYLAYEMHFNNCTFNNCKFYQTGKPKEDEPPPGTGGGNP